MSLKETSHKSSRPSENHARRRVVSERKILANRKNALRSTGPKTERGKRAVSRNATKYGILARQVVIDAGDGQESLEEFHALVEGLEKYYSPVGTMEETLVQIIVTCIWRKARVLRAENGEIRKRLDTLSTGRALRNSDEDNLALFLSACEIPLFNSANPADAKVPTVERYSALQAMTNSLREHPTGLAHLTTLLRVAKSEIASDGYMSENIRKKILQRFGLSDFNFALFCRNASAPEAKMADRPPKEISAEEIETDRALTIAAIDLQLIKLSELEEFALEREALAVEAEARISSLPPADATDKVQRYEAHLDRQLYRAMDQLERLQRQRRGENVPSPVHINLGRRT